MKLFLSAERAPALRQGREVVLEILWSCRGSEELINSVGLKVMSLAYRGAAPRVSPASRARLLWPGGARQPQTGVSEVLCKNFREGGFPFCNIESEASAAWRPVCLATQSSQAPKPHSGLPCAGLDGEGARQATMAAAAMALC